MGSICRPSDYGSGITEVNAFIQCADGQEPQINEFWCLVLEKNCRKVYPTAQVEVPTGTIEKFVTNYLSKMDTESRSSGKFPSTTASNFRFWPSQPGELEYCLFTT